MNIVFAVFWGFKQWKETVEGNSRISQLFLYYGFAVVGGTDGPGLYNGQNHIILRFCPYRAHFRARTFPAHKL